MCRAHIPSCGSNTALEPVSKFAEEPSALSSLVASCVVMMTYYMMRMRAMRPVVISQARSQGEEACSYR